MPIPTQSRKKRKPRASRAKPKPVPVSDPLKLTTPAGIREVLEMSLGAGVDHAFIMLGYLPRAKRDERLDRLCDAYRLMTVEQRADLDLERFCDDHQVERWEFLMWVVGSVTSLGGNATGLIINAAKFPIIKASLERALADPEEARQWLQTWGHAPLPSKGTIVNVHAQANAQSAAAASAIERGLPSFVETMEETDEAFRQLPATTAEPIDVPFVVREKEVVNVSSDR